MTLRLRHLRLRAETGEGLFGADIPFNEGLVVVRADNSRGKSTAVQGILFALGLERMITSRPDHAVTAAMRDRLIYESQTKAETPVLESWVSIEMENAERSAVAVTRWVKHPNIDSGLVRVAFGPALSDPSDYPSEDYYVGRAGAVANPKGFHRWLSSYIGWDLPELPAGDGRVAPLYMEQLFPLLFVEQRRGWAGIQAQMPYFSGVSDVRKRAIEFLLDLQVGKLEAQRQRLRSLEAGLSDSWRSEVQKFNSVVSGQGVVAVGVPENPTVTWPPQQEPYLADASDPAWTPIERALDELRQERAALAEQPVATSGEDAAEAEEQLRAEFREADRLRQAADLLRTELVRERQNHAALEERVTTLRDDLREHQDILTLERLGSPSLKRIHGDCPVCHQALPASLLLTETRGAALSPEATVDYIRRQLELFQTMELDGQAALHAREERLAAIDRAAAAHRARIRELRDTLTAPNSAPSVDAIARRVRLDNRITDLQRIEERFLGLYGVLQRLADEVRSVRAAIAQLPKDRLSTSDEDKLALLQSSFIEQLHQYDFGSFLDERLRISRDDYLPRREDFDLQADISASDSIRVVWAYLLALLEVGEELPTNHPRLLLFDEPRQQSAKEVSFKALLQRAGRGGENRQVIFATSEEESSLTRMLTDVPHTLLSIEGFLLRPV